MRDISFKGKRKDNSEWVEGYLFDNGMVDSKRMFIGSLVITEHKGLGEDVWDIGHAFYEVLPETVGQYTGLTDKNGKKIFEGDILAFSDRLVYVHWHDYCGCWDCSYIKAIDGKPTLHEDRSPNKWRYNAEVIGNIHDNKELLEVK